MTFFDKLNKVAKDISNKTGEAIETTKLNAKVNAEKVAMSEEFAKIGAHYYAQYVANGTAEAEVLEFLQNAKAHEDAAASAQAEIERIKADEPAVQTTTTGAFCPSCGAKVEPGVKFCSTCGQKMGE